MNGFIHIKGENLKNNITIIDEKNVYIEDGVEIGQNVTIYPNNYLTKGTVIEDDVTLMPNNFIKNAIIKRGASVAYSVIEDSTVGEQATVGPFARIRPESTICKCARIGNFVEIKKSVIGEGTKVSHLTYVGDAEVGKNVNVGCGVVFVNYNGRVKNKTIVGDESFIGSSVNLIAPVKIGNRAFICAGTTIVQNVNDHDFVIGRSRVSVKENEADNYLKEKE